RVRDRRPRRGLAVGGVRARVGERVAGGVRRLVRARRRIAAVREDQERTWAGPRRCPRAWRLCLAAMAEELEPVYLMAGSDRPKIDRALQRLRTRFAADAVELHSASASSGEDIVAVCNALGLFAGDGRLIVVAEAEAWKAADAKAIAAYLKAPAPATTLALVAGELKKDAPIAKVAAAAGEVLHW